MTASTTTISASDDEPAIEQTWLTPPVRVRIVRNLPRPVRVVLVRDERGDTVLVNWRQLLRPSTWHALFR